MFTALQPYAHKAPLVLRISEEEGKLRVLIHQEPGKNKDGARLDLVLTAAAEDLDRELPEVLATAEEQMRAATTPSVKEQAAAQIAAAAAAPAATEKKSAPAKAKATAAPAAKKKAPAKKTAKPKVTPTYAKGKPKAKPVKAAKPATKAKPAAASKPARPVKHIASRPDKAACIADYHAYLVAHPGTEPKREAFMAWAKTGRRFERLWGNWNKFIAEAAKTGTLGPADGKRTMPLDLPPPGDGKGPVTGIGYSVYLKNSGDLVGGIVRAPDSPPKNGDVIKMHDGTEWMVERVEDNRIIVYAWSPGADGKLPGLPLTWPFPTPAARIDVPDETTKTGRAIVTAIGNQEIATGAEVTAVTGEIFTHNNQQLRVLDFDSKTVWVEAVDEHATQGATA